MDQKTIDEYRDRAERETANVSAVLEYQRLVWAVQGSVARLAAHLVYIKSDDSELKIALECLASILPSKSSKAQDWLNVHQAKADLYTETFLAALFKAERL